MRRLFIIRKDLHLSAGKLAAMVGHCCEAYWTNLIKAGIGYHDCPSSDAVEQRIIEVDKEILRDYVYGIFTKTICECRNKNQLKKAEEAIAALKAEKDIELVEGRDFGYINDHCLTELTPENEDGTTTIGMWFRPLPDDVAHFISEKFQLYRS